MNVFELFAVLKLNKEAFKRGLQEAEGDANESSNKLKSAFSKVGDVAKVLATGAAAAVGAAGTGLAKITQSAIEAYGNYEQLVGGVEKLFGDNAKSVIQNAEQAYKTAGLSANEYMETVTSFSASLISSLGNDTEAAAKYADMALQDMSDNANVFGSDMATIQNAYQGFAKQNYTMLDNLKLGYGGTKTEMERLIADANKLKVANGETADLTIEKYSDVVEAIHLVQQNMKITGTTQKEASKTIQGSINATKAAWQNLMSGLADGNADVKKLTKNVIDSAKNVLHNVMPIIQQVAESIPEVITTIANELPGLIKTVLPALKKGVTSLLDALLDNLDEVLDIVLDIALDLVDYLLDNLPTIITKLFDGVVKIVEGICERLPELIPKLITAAIGVVGSVISGIGEAILGGISGIIEGLTGKVDVFGLEASRKLRETQERISDTITSWKDLKEQEAESISAANSEAGNLQALWEELKLITDENGNVKEGMENRASFIVGTLNESLGTEIELNGGVVSSMQDIEAEIDKLIEKKRAEAVMNAMEPLYEEALKNRAQAMQDLNTKAAELETAQQALNDATGQGKVYMQEYVDGLQAEYDALDTTVNGYYDTIAGYEYAYGEFQSGEYAKITATVDNYGNFLSTNLETRRTQLQTSIDEEGKTLDIYKTKFEECKNANDTTGMEMYQNQITASEGRLSQWNKELTETETAIRKKNDGMLHDQERFGIDLAGGAEITSTQYKAIMLSKYPALAQEMAAGGKKAGEDSDNGVRGAMDPGTIMHYYKQGFQMMSGMLSTAMYNIGYQGGQSMNAGAMDGIDAHSPSRSAMRVVRFFAAGATNQMKDSAQDFYNGAYALGENITAGVESAVSEAQAVLDDSEFAQMATRNESTVRAEVQVSSANDGVVNNKIDQLVGLLERYLPELDRPITLDGEVVSDNVINRLQNKINSEVAAYA